MMMFRRWRSVANAKRRLGAAPGYDTAHCGRRTRPSTTRHTVAEASAQLGISEAAVRLRIGRGTLQSTRIAGRRFVLLARSIADGSQSIDDHSIDASGERSSDGSATQSTDQAGELIAALRERIASLEDHLAASEEARRRSDHLVAALVERVQAIPATVGVQTMPQDAKSSPLRGNRGDEAPEPMPHASDTLALVWRRWWRRIRGNG